MDHVFHTIPGWFDFGGFYRGVVDRFDASHPGRFVEVGTWQGKSAAFFAAEIINSGKPISLDCVDHFQGSAAERDGPHALAKRRSIRDIAAANLEPFWRTDQNADPFSRVDNVLRIIDAPSDVAADQFADGSLDFVFIDAGHTRDEVLSDIAAWSPKVRRGGRLAGHDYSRHHPGVRRAVDAVFPNRRIAAPAVWFIDL